MKYAVDIRLEVEPDPTGADFHDPSLSIGAGTVKIFDIEAESAVEANKAAIALFQRGLYINGTRVELKGN